MEAFRGRGNVDYQASHDLEDFVAVIEGRENVVQEVAESPQDVLLIINTLSTITGTLFTEWQLTCSEFERCSCVWHTMPYISILVLEGICQPEM